MDTSQYVGRNSGTNSDFEKELLSYMAALRGYTIKLTRSTDKAEELLQTTLLKACAAHQSYQMGTTMKAWLFTIARNAFFESLKKAKREVLMDAADVEALAGGREPEYMRSHDAIDCIRYLANLPKEQSDAVVLTHYLGYSYRDTAATLDIPEGTVKSRINRARISLRTFASMESVAPVNYVQWSKLCSSGDDSCPLGGAYRHLYKKIAVYLR